jgi:mRNA interferase MazF
MATLKKPKRGEVWWVTFDPALGTEIKKCRPAIVISNDVSNKYLDRVQVVPLTSNITKVYASECLVQLSKQTGKAMADQIRTVSTERLVKKIEKLSTKNLLAVEQVVRLQLEL